MLQRVNVGHQFEAQNKRKYDEINTQKMREVEERRKIEDSIKNANEQDAKL